MTMIIDLILLFIVLWFIESIGLGGCALIFGVVNLICTVSMGFTLAGAFWAFVSGAITGVIAYFIALIALWLIRTLSFLGYIIVGAFFVLALLAIIF